MRYVYDRATDSLAISFADGRRYRDSEEIYDGIVIDYDTAGHPIGIEFHDRASRYVDTALLASGRWVEIAHPDLRPARRRITGAELRARRQVLGMTQEQLAEQLDTTKNTIARWERDEVRIEHGGMVRLALDALHNRTPSTITLPQLPKKRFASVPDSLVVMRADTVDLRANAIARTVVRNSATGAKFGGAPRSSRRSSKKR